jgi:predicted transcriptional regulator of viral defense system
VTETIGELSSREGEFLAGLAASGRTIFTTADAQAFWGHADYTANILSRLRRKGWIQRLERGVYLLIPLEAGPQRAWTESALVIAPYLVKPAAVAYWSALHYWDLTEQTPRVTFVQSTHRKRPIEIQGLRFRFIAVTPKHFFGIARRSLQGKTVCVTDREKTLIDAAARPDLSGGIQHLAAALKLAVADIDWALLDRYLKKWGSGSVVKRLGYLVETLELPVPDRDQRLARWQQHLSQGIALLDPSAPEAGTALMRWRVRVNVDVRGEVS